MISKKEKTAFYAFLIVFGIFTVLHLIFIYTDKAPPINEEATQLTQAYEAFIKVDEMNILEIPFFVADHITGSLHDLGNVITGTFLNLTGFSVDNSLAIYLLFVAILGISVFFISLRLFGPTAAAISSILVINFPGMIDISRTYFDTYVFISFLALNTLMLMKSDGFKDKRYSFLYALTFTLAIMAKFTAIIYIFPLFFYYIFINFLSKNLFSSLKRISKLKIDAFKIVFLELIERILTFDIKHISIVLVVSILVYPYRSLVFHSWKAALALIAFMLLSLFAYGLFNPLKRLHFKEKVLRNMMGVSLTIILLYSYRLIASITHYTQATKSAVGLEYRGLSSYLFENFKFWAKTIFQYQLGEIATIVLVISILMFFILWFIKEELDQNKVKYILLMSGWALIVYIIFSLMPYWNQLNTMGMVIPVSIIFGGIATIFVDWEEKDLNNLKKAIIILGIILSLGLLIPYAEFIHEFPISIMDERYHLFDPTESRGNGPFRFHPKDYDYGIGDITIDIHEITSKGKQDMYQLLIVDDPSFYGSLPLYVNVDGNILNIEFAVGSMKAKRRDISRIPDSLQRFEFILITDNFMNWIIDKDRPDKDYDNGYSFTEAIHGFYDISYGIPGFMEYTNYDITAPDKDVAAIISDPLKIKLFVRDDLI